MTGLSEHTFHIPVLGIGYSVDAPLKVAQYGISSVVSLVDDTLMEDLRRRYDERRGVIHAPIDEREPDARARRITAYLNMLHDMVKEQFQTLRTSPFGMGTDINKYFDMLPDFSKLKVKYREMLTMKDQGMVAKLQEWLRENMHPGSVDVNIMTKLDKVNYDKAEPLPAEFNDAHAAVRGFANSDLSSSVVFSAGMNPRLYSYLATFDDFFPMDGHPPKKKIVIKVSDFRSALIQGKFLAKKGLWVSEFRIESGLNCGGHAFATDGYLLGPILQEFKSRRTELFDTMRETYAQALQSRGLARHPEDLPVYVTVQGGVGTHMEQEFLVRHYGVHSVGWGTPWLLVPEVMNVDDDTLQRLAQAGSDDLYLSKISPLGVPFNSIRDTTKNTEKWDRVKAGKPGSKCIKKFLALRAELSEKPLCTASITYLRKKEQQLSDTISDASEFNRQYNAALEKECLCEGLIASALKVNNIEKSTMSNAVSVCPGPNMAYFSRQATLKEMVDHIYGRINLMSDSTRPNMFMKELRIYIDYLQDYIRENVDPLSAKAQEYVQTFRNNLMDGIAYYKNLIPLIVEEAEHIREKMQSELEILEQRLDTHIAFAV